MPDQKPADDAPRSSPQTDPTNPSRQESTGQWTSAEHASERHADEEGLTDCERTAREPGSKAGHALEQPTDEDGGQDGA